MEELLIQDNSSKILLLRYSPWGGMNGSDSVKIFEVTFTVIKGEVAPNILKV